MLLSQEHDVATTRCRRAVVRPDRAGRLQQTVIL